MIGKSLTTTSTHWYCIITMETCHLCNRWFGPVKHSWFSGTICSTKNLNKRFNTTKTWNHPINLPWISFLGRLWDVSLVNSGIAPHAIAAPQPIWRIPQRSGPSIAATWCPWQQGILGGLGGGVQIFYLPGKSHSLRSVNSPFWSSVNQQKWLFLWAMWNSYVTNYQGRSCWRPWFNGNESTKMLLYDNDEQVGFKWICIRIGLKHSKKRDFSGWCYPNLPCSHGKLSCCLDESTLSTHSDVKMLRWNQNPWTFVSIMLGVRMNVPF